MRGRGLHLAGARPDAGRQQGRRRRRRRAAHRQELHRRRAELQDGGRHAGRRRRQRGDRAGQRRRGRGGQPVHGGPPRHGCDGAAREDRRREGRAGGVAGRRWQPSPSGSTIAPAPSAWRSARALRRRQARRSSRSARARSSSASASTASRDGAGRSWAARPRWRRRWRRRSSTTSGWSRARACWPSSTAWAARRRSSSTCCSASCRSCSPSAGIEVGRSLVGPYITSLEMAGASFTLLELDSELEALWDAPVHTPALRWGV